MNKTSRLVKAVDFEDQRFRELASRMGESYQMHRKLWEFVVIAETYLDNDRPLRTLGFGVGQEPLPAFFAGRNSYVLATDRPDVTAEWTDTGQHAQSREQLRRPEVVADSIFDQRVMFCPVDMNNIPDDLLRGWHDMTWSAGTFEHLGSLDHGIEFFCKQMSCLQPGGLAVHTTEFNPNNDAPTLNVRDLCLYREQDLRVLEARLAAQGDYLWPLDLSKGDLPADLHVDHPPYGLPHLSLALGPYVTTSILLVAERGNR